MSNLKKVFRDNVVAPYNKYSLSQDNIGEVLEADADRNVCTVLYKNRDGIMVSKSNVPCKKFLTRGILKGFPKVGEYVELQDMGNTIRITGIVNKKEITETKQKTYDMYSGTSDFSGNLGI